jgi:uncharacterized Zn-finger protein
MTRKHEARHKKPFECDISNCPKTFGSVNDLARHKVSVHKLYKADDMVYLCVVCKKRSPRRDNLKQHLKTRHSILNPDSSIEERKARDCDIEIDALKPFPLS